jgi:hypothetical protein
MDGTTMVDAPAQHMQALELANRVRLARSALKRRVASGDVGVAEVVTTCPWEAQTMEISELLCSQRRWGLKRCRRFLEGLQIYEAKQIGSMTRRQRELLARTLMAHEKSEEVEAQPLWPAWAA